MNLSTEWQGSYYDTRSPVPRRVRITVEPSGLILHLPDGALLPWSYDELRQTQGRYDGEQVRFEHGTGIAETLVIPQTDILRAIHQQGGARAAHFHHPGRRGKRLFLTLAAGLACLPMAYAIFTWGVPRLSGPMTAAIPPSWEIQLGQFVQQEFTKTHSTCTDPDLSAGLDTIMTRLTAPLTDSPYTFHLKVIDSPLVNAMAAPGGYLILFRGLLEDTEGPEELAGVLAHEIQHVQLRHGLRLMVQHLSMAFVIAALSGDASGMMSYALQAAQTLQTLSYSRDAEKEADEQGMALLQQAGIDPQGMMTFFARLSHGQPDQSPFQYFSTHPPTEERLHRLEGLYPSSATEFESFPFAKDWKRIRNLCGNDQTSPQTPISATP